MGFGEGRSLSAVAGRRERLLARLSREKTCGTSTREQTEIMHSFLVSKYRKDEHVAIRNFECPWVKPLAKGKFVFYKQYR